MLTSSIGSALPSGSIGGGGVVGPGGGGGGGLGGGVGGGVEVKKVAQACDPCYKS